MNRFLFYNFHLQDNWQNKASSLRTPSGESDHLRWPASPESSTTNPHHCCTWFSNRQQISLDIQPLHTIPPWLVLAFLVEIHFYVNISYHIIWDKLTFTFITWIESERVTQRHHAHAIHLAFSETSAAGGAAVAPFPGKPADGYFRTILSTYS